MTTPAGDPPSLSNAIPLGVLSTRERQVLHLIAWGYANREIASRLELSVKTIESHRAAAMRKLRLSSKADLVRAAVSEGWLTREQDPQNMTVQPVLTLSSREIGRRQNGDRARHQTDKI